MSTSLAWLSTAPTTLATVVFDGAAGELSVWEGTNPGLAPPTHVWGLGSGGEGGFFAF